MAVRRYPSSYNRKVDPPLFSILNLVLHFFLFQNPSLHCHCPSLSLPRLPSNSPVLLSAHRFELCCIHTQTWCLCYMGSFISQPYVTLSLGVTSVVLQSSPTFMWCVLATLHQRQKSLIQITALQPWFLSPCPIKQFLRCNLHTSAGN